MFSLSNITGLLDYYWFDVSDISDESKANTTINTDAQNANVSEEAAETEK